MQALEIIVWIIVALTSAAVLLAIGYGIFRLCKRKSAGAGQKLTFKQWWALHKPTKRRLIQVYAALLFNINIKGFITGRIYTGGTKVLCVPGLNCYSCPGAVGACPLGALQNALASSNKRIPYYVFGIILLYGILFGRTICGWLCPVGLGQELLFKIKTPKLKKNKVTYVLSYFKYVVLVGMVVAIPLIFAFGGVTLPAFCKYLCPGGTLGGAVFLLAHPGNAELWASLGMLFLLKFSILVVFCVASVFIFRFFCRFFCPLGALYGLFNKFAPIGIKLDKSKCIGCDRCKHKCKMDIHHVGDHECINCGECVACCPTNAIKCQGLPKDGIVKSDQEPVDDKTKKKKRVSGIVFAVLAIIILLGAGVYYNFLDKSYQPNPTEQVYTIGDVCPNFELETINDEKFSLEEQKGKIVIVNFWATWCTGCVKELPDFAQVAEEYQDQVKIVAVDSAEKKEIAKRYVENKGWSSWYIQFAIDNAETVFKMLGGKDALPWTVIIDSEGVIRNQFYSSNYSNLKSEVDKILGAGA